MKINEKSLIEGLSYALDVAEKSYFSHSKHVAYTSLMIADELHFKQEEKKDLYYAAMLHDIGAGNYYNVKEHCVVGKDILLRLPLKPKLADYVLYHHEFYNGSGPFRLHGEQIPLESQIICISNTFNLQFAKNDNHSLEEYQKMEKWLNGNNTLFHPEVVAAFQNLLKKEYFLLDYYNFKINSIISKKIHIQGDYLEFEQVKDYAYAFSEIIDNRSPFTYRHSVGIADLAKKICIQLNYDEELQNKMYIAGLLHDIGKLVVSNDIIEKQGKLENFERYEINKHTYYTRWILEQIEGFEEITDFAANHHEKLNGNGYPLHLSARQLGEQERIIAICDIYQALTEERPYRAKLPQEKVWKIIYDMVEQGELDGNLVEKVKSIL